MVSSPFFFAVFAEGLFFWVTVVLERYFQITKIHLSIISLLWLVPLGLVLGFLRGKYNTLWYGMVAHFTYNFAITIFEFLGWF